MYVARWLQRQSRLLEQLTRFLRTARRNRQAANATGRRQLYFTAMHRNHPRRIITLAEFKYWASLEGKDREKGFEILTGQTWSETKETDWLWEEEASKLFAMQRAEHYEKERLKNNIEWNIKEEIRQNEEEEQEKEREWMEWRRQQDLEEVGDRIRDLEIEREDWDEDVRQARTSAGH